MQLHIRSKNELGVKENYTSACSELQRDSMFHTPVTSTIETNMHLGDTFCFAFDIPKHYRFIKAKH